MLLSLFLDDIFITNVHFYKSIYVISLSKLFWKKFGITGNNVAVFSCRSVDTNWSPIPRVWCVWYCGTGVYRLYRLYNVCSSSQVHCTAQVWHMSVYCVHCWSTISRYNKNSDIQLLLLVFGTGDLSFIMFLSMRIFWISLNLGNFKLFNSDFKLLKQTNSFSPFWLQILWEIHQLPTAWIKNLNMISQECKNYNGGWKMHNVHWA